MTDELREALRQTMLEQGISQAELARRIDKTRHAVNRALGPEGPKVPGIIEDILDALGLELFVRPKESTAQD